MPKPKPHPGFPAALRALRERRGWSDGDVAKLLKISRANVYLLENGHPATLERIWRIAVGLGVDPHELDPRLASIATKGAK